MFIRAQHWVRVASCCLTLIIAGCGGLQEVWEGPGAKQFRPQAIAVLPPMASQYDSAREDIQDVLSGALTKTARRTPHHATFAATTVNSSASIRVTKIHRLNPLP